MERRREGCRDRATISKKWDSKGLKPRKCEYRVANGPVMRVHVITGWVDHIQRFRKSLHSVEQFSNNRDRMAARQFLSDHGARAQDGSRYMGSGPVAYWTSDPSDARSGATPRPGASLSTM